MEEQQLRSKAKSAHNTRDTTHRDRERMSSPLVTGGCFALKSKINGKYLRYSPEKEKILEVSGEDVLSPYTRFRAELSREQDGHVHIRCCYNNKYWVAEKRHGDEWWIAGSADKPEEDLSELSCTLFQLKPVKEDPKTIRLFPFSNKITLCQHYWLLNL